MVDRISGEAWTVKLESTGEELFVTANGKRVAKRGHPGTPQAGTRISLEPGYLVLSNSDLSELVVEYQGVPVQ